MLSADQNLRHVNKIKLDDTNFTLGLLNAHIYNQQVMTCLTLPDPFHILGRSHLLCYEVEEHAIILMQWFWHDAYLTLFRTSFSKDLI